jgi:hypothetical protein
VWTFIHAPEKGQQGQAIELPEVCERISGTHPSVRECRQIDRVYFKSEGGVQHHVQGVEPRKLLGTDYLHT